MELAMQGLYYILSYSKATYPVHHTKLIAYYVILLSIAHCRLVACSG